MELVKSNLRDFKMRKHGAGIQMGWTAGLKGMGQSGCAL